MANRNELRRLEEKKKLTKAVKKVLKYHQWNRTTAVIVAEEDVPAVFMKEGGLSFGDPRPTLSGTCFQSWTVCIDIDATRCC